ncbi:hypothetical protein [Sulfobacillus thermosulfidooxidans]|uniref:hypothetical protein n=1 Tax=Sulfobacillus thermosulfidooxidans TaxID=28034 RepID=UPI0006B4D266|nr:hypothetical protein [Sulfobacillus thermosulfidooxidans]
MLIIVVRLANFVIGVMGLGVIAWGMGQLLRTLWRHYQGASESFPSGWGQTLPPVWRQVMVIAVGIVLVGLLAGGEWTTLITGLVRWSARWTLPHGGSA